MCVTLFLFCREFQTASAKELFYQRLHLLLQQFLCHASNDEVVGIADKMDASIATLQSFAALRILFGQHRWDDAAPVALERLQKAEE